MYSQPNQRDKKGQKGTKHIVNWKLQALLHGHAYGLQKWEKVGNYKK